MKYATQQKLRMAGVAAFALSIVVISGCGGSDSGSSSGSTTGATTTGGTSTGGTNGIVISAVAPSTVSLAAGQVVTVTGSGFKAKDSTGTVMPVTVQIGGVTVNSTVISDTTLNALTPAGFSAGVVDLRILNAAGISAKTASDQLTFIFVAPPTTGTTTGSTTASTTGSTTGATTATTTGSTTATTTGSTTATTTGATTASTTGTSTTGSDTSGPPPPP